MSEQLKATFMLLLAPLFWGVTFPLMHLVLHYCSADFFVFWRFLIAGAMLIPVLILAIRRRTIGKIDLYYGLAIGLMNCGAFLFQAIALESQKSSSEIAFLTGINVILVPLFMPLLGMRKPQINEVIAAFICLFGVFIINNAKFSFSEVDILVVFSTICIAIGMILVEKASLVSKNLQLLTFYQIIFTSIIPFAYLKGIVLPIPSQHIVWFALGYCAIFATIIPILFQLKYQHVIGSNKAAIIYSLEAVFAMIFALLVFGESITINVVVGGSIIIFSVIYNDIIKLFMTRYTKS